MIRDATEKDLPSITAIYCEAVLHGTASYEIDPPDLAEMTRRFTAIREGGYPYLVMQADAAVQGYAYASAFRPRLAYRYTVENSVYVAPHLQGRGVGRTLLEALIAACTERGFRQIVAVIGDGSPSSASVKLHGALGFVHAGTIQGSGFKHGRWLDTVYMQLAINGGRETLPG